MPRPYTPPLLNGTGGTRLTVKRSCSNCFRDLGDANDEELAAAVVSEALPDTTDECGCGRIIEQLALLTNRFDHEDSGTALWANLGPDAHESYLAFATNTVRALVHLGWGPAPTLTEQLLDQAAAAAWASTGPSVANGFAAAEEWEHADTNQKNRWRRRAAAAIATTRTAVTA